MNTPRVGRPPLPPEDKRSVRLELRLNSAEHDVLAAAAGDVPLGVWVREVALVKAAGTRRSR